VSEVEIVVHVNGKLKAKIKVAKDLSREELTEAGKAAVELNCNIVKVIAVPNKLVNIVVKP
jgi:leucyl-tRNA synthetase